MQSEIGSYDDARRALTRAGRTGRIGHNTYVAEAHMGAVAIILHRTPIVIYYPDGKVKLNSGGWHTVTTKARMNAVLPPWIRVYQERHDWFVKVRGEKQAFYDGMEIQSDAGPVLSNPHRQKYHGPNVHELFEELKDIRKYLRNEEIEETDVRLQVVDDGWMVHTGDASYDTDHRGAWGAGSVSRHDTDNDLRAIGADLIAEVQEDLAQMD